MLHALLYYYSLQSYCSSTGDATRSTLLLYSLYFRLQVLTRCFTGLSNEYALVYIDKLYQYIN